jgi:hypothetical protein
MTSAPSPLHKPGWLKPLGLATQPRWRVVPHRLFLAALQASKARYAVAGDLALLLFGYEAPSMGMRVVVPDDVANLQIVVTAAHALGYTPRTSAEAALNGPVALDLGDHVGDAVWLDGQPRIAFRDLVIMRRVRAGIDVPVVGLRDLVEIEGLIEAQPLES